MSFSSGGANLYTQGFGSRPENVEVPVVAPISPTIANVAYPIGKRWINTVSNVEYVLTSLPMVSNVVTAVWTLNGTNTGPLNTLSDGSTVVTPTGGNIEILGTGSEITSTGTNGPGAITLSFPSAMIAPGSFATTTTLAVGTNATVAGTLGVTGASTLHALTATTGSFSSTLGVTGTTTLAALTQAGTANINASGAAVTTIGTGGTGAVHIGNATGNTAVTGSITSSTGITATTGNITATAGNLVATAGNLALNGAASKVILNVGTAASASAGTATLGAGGTVTVSTSAVTAASLIYVSCNTPAGTQGILSAPSASIVAATSFVINSSNAADTSTVNWWLIN